MALDRQAWAVTMASDPEKFLTLSDVIDRVAVTRSTIYRWMQAGSFPRPIKVGIRSLWLESDIQAWIREQIARPQSEERADG